MADNQGKTLAVIGGGPGGYPAAFLAADLGMSVTLIDTEARPGGVCLHRGCIPSKALLHVARFLAEAREAEGWGVSVSPQVNLDRLRKWKDGVVDKITGGLMHIRKKRAVNYIHGRAHLADAHTVVIDRHEGGQEELKCDHIIIATGSVINRLPDLPSDPRIMDSDNALALPDVPGSLLVIGGGYIGLELGTVYAALGSRVTVVEMTPWLLPGVDRDLVKFLTRRLNDRFESVLTDTKVLGIEPRPEGLAVRMIGQAERTFDRVLVAVGRRPASADLGLESTGVQLDRRGFIRTNRRRQSNEANIYAIGDVAGEPMLAHKATYEARIAAEAIAQGPDSSAAFDPQAIPAVVFTDPEVAWAGLTEEQAKASGRPFKVARFPWLASGRAATLDRNDGLTKLVLDPLTERVLGVGIVGVSAGELIAEGVLAVEMGARAEDLMMTIHAHPTLSETVMEAAEVYFGHSPHYVPPK